ncbi:hypothetical protein [Neisseria zalophi]|nr:hypothetical protein [Neisseria zalophi]
MVTLSDGLTLKRVSNPIRQTSKQTGRLKPDSHHTHNEPLC